MSVRVNQRRISELEYENTYSKLVIYLSQKLHRLPKRYYNFLTHPVNEIINCIYEKIIEMTTMYNNNQFKSIYRYRKGLEIFNDINELIKYSYVIWNISNGKNGVKYIKYNSRVFWANTINKEIALLYGVMKKCNGFKEKEVTMPIMRVYSFNQIKNTKFLVKLYKLQRIIYKIAIQQNKFYKDAQIDLLVKLSRDAFADALDGNSILIENSYTYKRRKNSFTKALNELYSMNRPIKELAFLHIFSEKDLENICNYIDEATLMIKAIQNYDKNKFPDFEEAK